MPISCWSKIIGHITTESVILNSPHWGEENEIVKLIYHNMKSISVWHRKIFVLKKCNGKIILNFKQNGIEN